MEKQFKLIKTYPGSPPIGTIALNIRIRYNFLKNGSCFAYTETEKEAQDIENSPEFWEQIKEDTINDKLIKLGNIPILTYNDILSFRDYGVGCGQEFIDVLNKITEKKLEKLGWI
jgi:hypothetical protein